MIRTDEATLNALKTAIENMRSNDAMESFGHPAYGHPDDEYRDFNPDYQNNILEQVFRQFRGRKQLEGDR